MKWRYSKNPILRIVGTIKDTISASYLCIKYPFLYPRNAWTGHHYNYWPIHEYHKNNYSKAYDFRFDDDGNMQTVTINKWWAFKIQALDLFHEWVLEPLHCIPLYTYYDMVPDGWKAIFLQLCDELKRELKDKKILYTYRIVDIKEKYGALVHDSYGETKETNKLWEKYEYITARTCIVCGKTADYISEGYILPYCEDHADERVKVTGRRLGTKNNTFYGYWSVGLTNKEEEENEQ